MAELCANQFVSVFEQASLLAVFQTVHSYVQVVFGVVQAEAQPWQRKFLSLAESCCLLFPFAGGCWVVACYNTGTVGRAEEGMDG